jgi:hypothetical protein
MLPWFRRGCRDSPAPRNTACRDSRSRASAACRLCLRCATSIPGASGGNVGTAADRQLEGVDSCPQHEQSAGQRRSRERFKCDPEPVLPLGHYEGSSRDRVQGLWRVLTMIDVRQVLTDRLRELDAEAKGIRKALVALGGTVQKTLSNLADARTNGRRRRRKMSADARKRIAAATKARWAAAKRAGRAKL